MATPPRIPSLAEVKACAWEAIAATVTQPTCHEISTQMFARAHELEGTGDTVEASVFRFIGSLAFMYLRPDNKDEPLGAAIVDQASRSAIPSDFDESALDTIASLAATTKIIPLRARFLDILYLRRKDFKAGYQAAIDYLAAFKLVDDLDHWVVGKDELDRGMGIVRGPVGNKKPLFAAYVSFIEKRLGELETTCEDAYALHLLGLLGKYRAGDTQNAARLAESIGDRLESTNKGFLARKYYDLGVHFQRVLKDNLAVDRVGQKKGLSLVSEADACLHRPAQGIFAAVHHLAAGVECLRQFRAKKTVTRKLHQKLLKWQRQSGREMKSHSHEVNISKAVKIARKLVRGKSIQEAIFTMALGHPVLSVEALRERVIENTKRFPIATLFGATMMAADGRTVAHKPSGLTNDKAEHAKFVETEMFHQAAQVDWGLRAQAYIEVCRFEIWKEHDPRLEDLHFLVLQNPLVPVGHENIFLRGIHAGFRGEFDVVAHFLVPQVEESIRHVLRQAGHITSKLDNKLIQDVHLLGTLLSMPETTTMFGEDTVFELRGLLVEKFGFDLRNRLAHGFIKFSQFWGADVINFWWLMLRLLCIPTKQRLRAKQS